MFIYFCGCLLFLGFVRLSIEHKPHKKSAEVPFGGNLSLSSVREERNGVFANEVFDSLPPTKVSLEGRDFQRSRTAS